MVFIWLLVGANHIVHVFVCDFAGPVLMVIGHGLLFVQIICFARTVGTHPGIPPPNWPLLVQDAVEDAHQLQNNTDQHRHGAGTTDCTPQCSDKIPVPPRARYVKKRGEVILGFDHDCFWMGVPIGFRNRKYFILFVLWSSALSLFGAGMSAAELYHSAPVETLLNSAAPANSEVLLKLRQLERSQGAYGAASPDLLLLSYQISTMKLDSIYFSLVLALLFVADVVAGLLLGCFGTEHVKMAMRNQTTLHPAGEEEYDLGTRANLEQIFGRPWFWWVLPIRAGSAAGDGLNWPRRRDPFACVSKS